MAIIPSSREVTIVVIVLTNWIDGGTSTIVA